MSRRRKRKNPVNNHSGLGAFIGSIIGGIPGHLLMALGAKGFGAVVTWVGWAGGAALGGYYGAKDDRKRRGAIGGGLGGVFLGPIGAALGGYLAGFSPDSKKSNPRMNPAGSTILLALGGGVLAAATGYGAYRLVQRRRAQLPGGGEGVASILGASTTIGDVPYVMLDIQQPIMVQTPEANFEEYETVPVLNVLVAGQVESPAGAMFGVVGSDGLLDDTHVVLVDEGGTYSLSTNVDPKAISTLITGLTPEHTRAVYELALVQIGNGVDWSKAADRDAAIGRILTQLVPSSDWSQGLSPYAYGGAEWKAWTAVQLLGTVANQSYYNKRTLGGAA